MNKIKAQGNNIRKHMLKKSIYFLIIFSASLSAQANSLQVKKDYQQCLLQAIESAADTVTISELKAGCQSINSKYENESVQSEKSFQPDLETGSQQGKGQLVEQRLKEESLFAHSGRGLTGHKPNYIIYSYNTKDPETQVFEQQFPGENIDFDQGEIKFQISTKFLIAEDLFGDNGNLYAAYTNRSFWQASNDNISSPFRDYNHEPEIWLSFKNDYELWGFKNSIISAGFVHQSNGRAGSLSRSWNRVYANFVVEKDNFVFSFKPWYRIKEDDDDDDNPDIEKYLGHFEFQSVYKHNDHSFALMFRNNLRTGENRGASQLDWTFPLHKNFKGYLQWFNGYGESLIDYNHNVNAIGLGIKFTDWL